MNLVAGFVIRLERKDGKGKNPPYRPYTLWSALIENPDGSEFGWVGFGFDEPGFNEGDYVEFQYKEENGRKKFIEGTGKKPKNPPARAKKSVETPSGDKVSSTEGFNRQTNPIDAERMSYANAREHAIRVTELLLNNKALAISKADSGAGVAKRFEEITAAVDKLTVQYARDSITQRLFAVVSDAGELRVDKKADGPIPSVKPKGEDDGKPDGTSDDAGDDAGDF